MGVDDDDSSAVDVESLLNNVAESRPSRATEEWADTDHYNDAPDDSFDEREWKETNTRMEKILVNGARRRQWKFSIKEIEQIMAQCRVILEKTSLRREDFTEHFFGAQSPIFLVFQSRLQWSHVTFMKLILTSARLSANNWSMAKLYDDDHPQGNMDRVMPKDEY